MNVVSVHCDSDQAGGGVPPIGGALSAFLTIPDKEIADSTILSAGGAQMTPIHINQGPIHLY